ncbi:hypothetical protein [Pedobacter roseus]|jgi:hypothetical protein|uniref:Autotransporter outer membrane beta-barrel domain-containing protein n=1 Tax=Pedobacter roseus TaxID=336820 RepID=A0A7G9QLC5_9SPHI|nr:hypothetical protein [Pedobacter roseus]QNN44150.1 hypothetical protein H9L23_08775 [Pedobacter roseus]
MKLKLLTPMILLCAVVSIKAKAQGRPDKLYSMSGIGFAFPMGETSDYFKPKFSTSLGLNLGLGDGGLFLYPKVSLHAFTFNQITPDEGYTYTLQKGRATTYLLNVALGYRKIVNKWAFYGFAGAGGGIILTPQAAVNASTLQVTQDNKSNSLGIAEGGAGIEYNIGGANLFVEASYMYGFSKIQNRTFNTVPINIGIKPNLSKLLSKLK